MSGFWGYPKRMESSNQPLKCNLSGLSGFPRTREAAGNQSYEFKLVGSNAATMKSFAGSRLFWTPVGLQTGTFEVFGDVSL